MPLVSTAVAWRCGYQQVEESHAKVLRLTGAYHPLVERLQCADGLWIQHRRISLCCVVLRDTRQQRRLTRELLQSHRRHLEQHRSGHNCCSRQVLRTSRKSCSTPPGHGTIGQAQLRMEYSVVVHKQCIACPSSWKSVFISWNLSSAGLSPCDRQHQPQRKHCLCSQQSGRTQQSGTYSAVGAPEVVASWKC